MREIHRHVGRRDRHGSALLASSCVEVHSRRCLASCPVGWRGRGNPELVCSGVGALDAVTAALPATPDTRDKRWIGYFVCERITCAIFIDISNGGTCTAGPC